MDFYRRHLPHWHPEGSPLFVTWRLRGSLPRFILERIRAETLSKVTTASGDDGFVAAPESDSKATARALRFSARQFLKIDRFMDRATRGPLWLKDSRIAGAVIETLHFAATELELYRVEAYVVMANHIHILILPNAPLARITKSVKGYSAKKANEILNRTGEAFWQDESFDHWVRRESSFGRIKHYIENNPVSAGLVRSAEEWPWSSASHGVGQASRPVP